MIANFKLMVNSLKKSTRSLRQKRTDYRVTVSTPRNYVTNLSEIGDIIAKLKLNGFQVDIGTCDKAFNIG